MRRIAHDVERLMWLVAEERDPRAIADFEARFPDLKYELAKHIAMVSGLKEAARKTPPHSIPRFVPRHRALRPGYSRTVYVAFAFVLGALAFGSYAGITLLSHGPENSLVRPLPDVDAQPKNPVVDPPSTGGNSHSPQVAPNVQPGQSDPPPVASEENPLDRVVNLDPPGDTPLTVAIKEIEKQTGVRCDIAPGMPRMDVTLHYVGVSAARVLDDLGRRYGFTPVPQELGVVLLIPARADRPEGGPESTEPTSPDPRLRQPQEHTGTDGR